MLPNQIADKQGQQKTLAGAMLQGLKKSYVIMCNINLTWIESYLTKNAFSNISFFHNSGNHLNKLSCYQ